MRQPATPILSDGAYVFDGPDFRYNKVFQIFPGELLDVLNASQYPWYQIRTSKGRGWIPSTSIVFVNHAFGIPAHVNPEFILLWPTDYYTVTQPFNVNAGFYSKFGLPGHEGLDIRAPSSTNIYSGADGVVYLVHDGYNNHPYGIHVRIKHKNGYQTIYAHLQEALVKVNDVVKAKQKIGLADSTGNSTGPHLHLTLKKEGSTAAGRTIFPNDIVDPTPYLVF